MKTLRTLCLATFAALFSLQAQESKTDIELCQQKARDNYPLIKQHGLIEASSAYQLSNLSKAWLPQLSMNGQATWQTDVTSVPISLPGIDIPSIDKDQYKIGLDISQKIWDGGNTRAQRKLANAEKEVNKQSLDTELYAIRDRVNQLYFGILTMNARLAQLQLLKEDLQNALKVVTAGRDNGVALPSDIDVVKAELLTLEQQAVELRSYRTAYLQMLSAMTSLELDESTAFAKPQGEPVDPAMGINRPEIGLFRSQLEKWDSQQGLITAKNRPQFSLFLQGGYGKPGLNMLSNEFDWFGIAGVRLSWNFGQLYSLKNDRRLIETGKSQVDVRLETFLFNTRLQLKQAYNEILKSREVLEQDDEIIALRHKIRLAAESKYENGVYTINDLLKDIHAENQSKQARILHETQYLLNIHQYKNISGN